MDRGGLKTATVVAVAVLASFSVALAKPTPQQKFRHADRNNDGTVDRTERTMERNWELNKRSNVNTKWEEKADTDQDGKVSATEAETWKQEKQAATDLNGDGVIDSNEKLVSFKQARSRVNTAVETKYDADGDGWISCDEAKQLLQDKYTIIKTDGKAKVDTAVEKAYDTNLDGVIDSSEAAQIKEILEAK